MTHQPNLEPDPEPEIETDIEPGALSDDPPDEHLSVTRRPVDQAETAAANRAWWDGQADEYYDEHGGFLGDADFVWGPEGLREADLDLLGLADGVDAAVRVLEIGAGAGQCSRWLATEGVTVVATDLSIGMLRQGRAIDRSVSGSNPGSEPLPSLQCDGTALPFADASFDVVFTAYGVVPFVADSARVMREVARVLRPGGRFVFSTTHPIRWALPDSPGRKGLEVTMSYFDRTPYVEQRLGPDGAEATYVEHHRTMGDRVRELVAAGLTLVDVVEPEWPAATTQTWGGWSPLRGELIPGTAIFVAVKR